ncbi:MAG: NUDIX hydrolase [Gemmatimonadota bacterium]|nr:MAG: NUDIX hydrolase [Gemmatimonadota bacterium]
MNSQDSGSRVSSDRVYDGRMVKVDVDVVKAPDGSELRLEMVRHPGAAAVVPLLSDPGAQDPCILLIRQYRYAADGVIWEIPAGVLEPGEAPIDCARRELLEEVGATARELSHLTTIYTTPGFTDERIHLFLATGISVGTARHEQDEFIEVEVRPISKVLEMIRDGDIVDSKSITALLFTAGFHLGL